jgi:hypothetical protein
MRDGLESSAYVSPVGRRGLRPKVRRRGSGATRGSRRGLWLLVAVMATPIALLWASGSPKPGPAGFGSTVDGLRVLSVSEALATLPTLGDSGPTIAVAGYWSSRLSAHSCVPPQVPPGRLELRCHDGEYGISEANEPILVVDRDGGRAAASAHMSPYIAETVVGAEQLFSLPEINGQRFSSVPILGSRALP